MARGGGGAKEFVVVVNRPEGQRNERERERERERWIGISFDFHQKKFGRFLLSWFVKISFYRTNFIKVLATKKS